MDDLSRWELQGLSIVDPVQLFEACRQHDWPTEPWLGKCNSVTYPIGPEAGLAYFLVANTGRFSELRSKTLAETAPHLYESPNAIKIRITDVNGRTRDSYSWIIVESKCVTPSYPNAPDAVYMITMRSTDYLNGWYGISDWSDDTGGYFSTQFNRVRRRRHQYRENPVGYRYFIGRNVGTSESAVWDGYFYDAETSTRYTWAQMLSELGVDGGDIPYTPSSTPTDFDFTNSWRHVAVHAVLDRLGCAARFKIFDNATGDYEFFEMGKPSSITSRDQSLDQIKDYLIWDFSPKAYFVPDLIRFRMRIIIRELKQDLQRKTTIAANDTNIMVLYDPSATASGVLVRTWQNDKLDVTDEPYMQVVTMDSPGAGFQSYAGPILDHDNPFIVDCLDTVNGPTWTPSGITSIFPSGSSGIYIAYLSDLQDSIDEHAEKYRQSCLDQSPVNRVYAGFHTSDAILPNGAVKIIRWEDLGKGAKTHVYAGDKYFPPHSVYHAVNPHGFSRRDDHIRFMQLADINLANL